MREKESKHKRRRQRREQYYEMLDDELSVERHFKGRVIDALNHEGLDIGPDGKPIRSDWWGYMKSRDRRRINNSRACLYLLQQSFRGIRPETI